MQRIMNLLSLDFLSDEGCDAKYIWDDLLEILSFCLYFILFNIVYKHSNTGYLCLVPPTTFSF